MKSRKTNSNAVSGATGKRSSKIAPPVNRERAGVSARLLARRRTADSLPTLYRERPGVSARLLARKRTADSLPSLYRERPGVSLLLGLGIIFIMVFFSLLVSNVVVSSIRQSANVSRSNEAYYAAEGALEQGLLENFKKGAGYTSGNEPVDYDNPNLSANFQIQGTVPEELKYGDKSAFAGMYGVPTPGTGNAGANCDVNKPVINQYFTYSTTTKSYTYTDTKTSSNFDPADHPCNWNKIKTGETVTIPLYYEDEKGDFVNLFNDASNEFRIRIRTVCRQDHEFCIPTSTTTTGRYQFQLTNQEPKPINDPILTWQVEGFNAGTGKTESLRPEIIYDYENEIRMQFNIVTERSVHNTSFGNYNSRKHVVGEFSTLVGVDINNNRGCVWQFFGSPQTGFAPCNLTNPWINRALTKPVIKLSVIGELIPSVTTVSRMPYLEYQILTSANLGGNSGPTNTAQTITAEGVSGTFKQVLQVNQPQAGGLPDYVVQQ